MAGTPQNGRRPRSRRRRWLWWVLVGLAVLVPVYGRALLEARAELRHGEAVQATDAQAAIQAYRHAVEWTAPINPYADRAVDHLLALGLAEPTPEGTGREQALLALESLRTAIMVTRSVYTPYASHLPAIEGRIASMRGAEAAQRTGNDPAAETARQAELLRRSRERAPHTGWALLTTLAFVAWIGLTWRTFRTAYDEQGRLRRRHLLLSAALSAVALTTWIAGLTLV